MGSPFMSISVQRVNVIRTPQGFIRLFAELMNICDTSEGHLDIAQNWMLSANDPAVFSPRGLSNKELRSIIEKSLWDDINELDCWDTSSAAMVELLTTFMLACKYRSRVVNLFATSYDQPLTKRLDRVIVMDMTKYTESSQKRDISLTA